MNNAAQRGRRRQMTAQTENLSELRELENRALEAFNEAHANVEVAVKAQGESARKRAGLVEQHRITQNLCRDCEAGAMEQAARGEFLKFTNSASKLANLKSETALLARSITYFDAFPAADCERALLVARHAEQVARHAAEVARRDAHKQNVLKSIAQASAVAGGLAVEGLGPIGEELSELVESARRDVLEAQRQLEVHDTATRDARQVLEDKRP